MRKRVLSNFKGKKELGEPTDNIISHKPVFFRRGPLYYLTAGMTGISMVCVIGILIFLLRESWPVFAREGWNFLLSNEWWPGESYGALAMIYGSCMVTILALVWALPFALAGAVLTSEFLSPKLRLLVKGGMEFFAGIPGIIYGLLGMALLTSWVRETFGLIDGNSIFSASLLLGMMVLPTIMTLSEDAFHSVPGHYRDTSLSLGLTRWQTVYSVVVPHALPGIAGAVFLGIGRAMGETIAVMLVIGGIDQIPEPWFDVFSPGQSIPSKLGREAAEALGSGLHWSALMGLGLTLLVIVTITTATGNLLLKRIRG